MGEVVCRCMGRRDGREARRRIGEQLGWRTTRDRVWELWAGFICIPVHGRMSNSMGLAHSGIRSEGKNGANDLRFEVWEAATNHGTPPLAI
jgi:hypothetical protein